MISFTKQGDQIGPIFSLGTQFCDFRTTSNGPRVEKRDAPAF